MRYLFFSIIGSLFFVGTTFAQTTHFSSEKAFVDVSNQSPQYKAIEYLRKQNVIRGYKDGTFRPDTYINRAEFAEFVVNPLILDTNDRNNCITKYISTSAKTIFFPDVSRDAWYATDVCYAKVSLLINGYPDGRYRPSNSINFVEAAKILSNVFSLNISSYQTGEFWYKPYVLNLSSLHAIPTSIKRLEQSLTRGEMAQIVYRLINNDAQQPSMAFNQTANTLSQRAYIAPMQPDPIVPVTTFNNRPSARSIHLLATMRNVLRISQKK